MEVCTSRRECAGDCLNVRKGPVDFVLHNGTYAYWRTSLGCDWHPVNNSPRWMAGAITTCRGPYWHFGSTNTWSAYSVTQAKLTAIILDLT
jgi:hypothetical protein